uniref:WASH complex subunit 3 n=1 Tax=Spermophilus dauricus TaxID=99837 RepID=A0A8C9UJ48_SPEDA
MEEQVMLPFMGSGIDVIKVPPVQQNRLVAFLNQFVVHFDFSSVCEEKPADLSLWIQQIETTLNILDARLSSIQVVTFEACSLSVTGVTDSETISVQAQRNGTQASGAQESEVSSKNI